MNLTSCQNDRTFDSSQLRKNIADSLIILENYYDIPGTVVGHAGRPSKHLDITNWVQHMINSEEAIILYNHENPLIKTIAFKKMWKDGNHQIFNIIINAYSDTTNIYEATGCESLQYKIFDYYLREIRYPDVMSNHDKRLSIEQLTLIDSLAKTRDYWSEHYIKPPNKNSIRQ